MNRIIYCFDAYCGWCYGFSPVITRLANEYGNKLEFEVFSGGMIPDEHPKHLSVTSAYIQLAYKNVEELTGVKFGSDYLWHINHPQETDWFPESTTPATALCIFKEYRPEKAIHIAADLQYALHFEGRDLTDKEAYRHLLTKYEIPEEEFFTKLKTEAYRQKAYYEFALVKQLQVTAFPVVLLQVADTRFHLLSRGYTPYEVLQERLEQSLERES